MPLRKLAFALLALCAAPAAACAGPVEYRLTPTGFWVDPEQKLLTAALYSTFEPGSFVVDPASGMASTTGPLVNFDYNRLPEPRPEDLNPGGASAWNNSGNFRLDFRLTDVASGESANLSVWGRAHGQAFFADSRWYTGGVAYWFGDGPQGLALGGQDYVIWGQQRFTGDRPELSVWVGPNPPFPWVPEPGTLALAGLGLAPLALRRLRARPARA